jgi:hypothetical protein
MKTTRDSNSVHFYRLKVSYQNTLVVTASIIRKWIGWDSNWVPAPIKAKRQNETTTDPNGRSPVSFKNEFCAWERTDLHAGIRTQDQFVVFPVKLNKWWLSSFSQAPLQGYC